MVVFEKLGFFAVTLCYDKYTLFSHRKFRFGLSTKSFVAFYDFEYSICAFKRRDAYLILELLGAVTAC